MNNNDNSFDLFYFDFSAIVNIGSAEQLQEIIDMVMDNSLKVVVNREFYDNYKVIIQCDNEFQKNVARMTYNFLTSLNNNHCLMYIPDPSDCDYVIKSLHANDRVRFVFYRYSEFSEIMMKYVDTLRASSIVVQPDGTTVLCHNKEELLEHASRVVNTSVLSDAKLKLGALIKEDDEVKLRDGTVIRLLKKLGSGGEGAVYDCNYKFDYVVKIYHEGQITPLRLTKLSKMEQKQVIFGGLCWPEKMVFSMSGEPVGYIMKKVHGKNLSNIFDGDEEVLRAFPDWDRSSLVYLARDIFMQIQYLHLQGILIGDLRMKNIMVDSNGRACLVDLDSCQIDDIPCPAGFADFTPPELQNVEFKHRLRDYYNEDFSCAVVMFKLLFCGIHPYDQKFGADTIEEEIRNMTFPYPETNNGDFERIPWGPYERMWKHTPRQIQKLFIDVFRDGNRAELIEIIKLLELYIEFLKEYEEDDMVMSLTYEYEE